MHYQSEMIVLENDKLLDLFIDAKPMRYLRPFFEKPLSLTEASEIIGLAMNTYHYWITKFLDYGLLVVAYIKKRAGSSIKYYMTPAKKILLKVNKRADLFESFYQSYIKQSNLHYLISQNISDVIQEYDLDLGILLKLDVDNSYWTVPVMISEGKIINGITNEMLESQYPSAFYSSRTLLFRPEDAKELQRRLVSVLVEFDKRVDTAGEKYYIEVAMAPAEEKKQE